MAIADDFSVAVNGDIRYTGTTANYTVLELHRFLQDLADDASASGGDLVDITSDTPSDRSTDNIITLLGTYNIDDTAAEHLYAGSITQADGDTVYSGLQVLGAVNNTDSQLMVIQDNGLYQYTTDPSVPFWGTQSSGGYNGNDAAGILMRCMIKSREFGADIDGKRIRVQCRTWGDSYDFFNVRLGQGESVAAIGTTPDAQNTTGQGDVNAYTHVTNTEGYQTIDLNNGNGPQEYYSLWTYGVDTSADGLKGVWEYIKDISANGTVLVDAQDETSWTGVGNLGTFTTSSDWINSPGADDGATITMSDGTIVTIDAVVGTAITEFTIDNSNSHGVFDGETITFVSTTGSGTDFTLTPGTDNVTADKTIHGISGNKFLGITHSFVYNTEVGTFAEDEVVVWGTDITYDTLVGGTFAAGDYVTIGALGASGRVMYDNGTTNMIVALDDPTITLVDGDVITVADGVGAVTAAINVTILNNANNGGSGLLLALDDDGTTGNQYIQLLTGAAPVSTLPVRGLTSGATAIAGAVSSKTIPKTFLGSYTGTLIGAYGIGVDPDDLTAVDTIQDLAGVTQTPPNNVTFTVSGLISGEDRVLVGPRATGVLQKDQDTINGTLTDNVTTSVVMTTAIPVDTPATGQIRIQDDNGVYTLQPYTSYTGSTYTLTAAYQGSDDADATTGNNAFIAYIDELAGATSATFTTIYNSGLGNRDLFVRVRDGGATPIKTFEAPATLTSSGGSVAAIRTSDA